MLFVVSFFCLFKDKLNINLSIFLPQKMHITKKPESFTKDSKTFFKDSYLIIRELFMFYYDSFFHATNPLVKLDPPAVLNKYVFSTPPPPHTHTYTHTHTHTHHHHPEAVTFYIKIYIKFL